MTKVTQNYLEKQFSRVVLSILYTLYTTVIVILSFLMAELRLLSLAAPRARKVKLSSFMDAMATPPMICKSVA